MNMTKIDTIITESIDNASSLVAERLVLKALNEGTVIYPETYEYYKKCAGTILENSSQFLIPDESEIEIDLPEEMDSPSITPDMLDGLVVEDEDGNEFIFNSTGRIMPYISEEDAEAMVDGGEINPEEAAQVAEDMGAPVDGEPAPVEGGEVPVDPTPIEEAPADVVVDGGEAPAQAQAPAEENLDDEPTEEQLQESVAANPENGAGQVLAESETNPTNAGANSEQTQEALTESEVVANDNAEVQPTENTTLTESATDVANKTEGEILTESQEAVKNILDKLNFN